MEQSASKIACRNMTRYIKEGGYEQPAEESKKGLLARNMPKENPIKNKMDSIADYVLSIKKAFNNDDE
jgi:hypothetical protein|tara:strand:- start:278 stop:481 length:204 start_codon:yes stop_codon:yes gene_type:complete